MTSATAPIVVHQPGDRWLFWLTALGTVLCIGLAMLFIGDTQAQLIVLPLALLAAVVNFVLTAASRRRLSRSIAGR